MLSPQARSPDGLLIEDHPAVVPSLGTRRDVIHVGQGKTYDLCPVSTGGRFAYPFTPPAVKPPTRFFWRNMKRDMTGTMAKIAPTANQPQGLL